MKIKIRPVRSLFLGITALLTFPAVALINPDAGPNYPGECPDCEDSPSAENFDCKSFDWSLNVGLSTYAAPDSYVKYARMGVVEGSLQGAMPRSLDTILGYYEGSGYINRHPLKLVLSSPVIDASLRDPSNFTYSHSSNAEIIELNGFVNQIRTDDSLTHVDKTTDGFIVRMWNLNTFTLQNKVDNLYPVPNITTDNSFLTKITFKKPIPTSSDSELLVISIQNFGSSLKKTTRHFKEVVINGKPETLTIKMYDGETTSSPLVKIEKLTYSNRGAKVWDYHIERKIWTAKTTAAGTVNGTIVPPTMIPPVQTDDSFLTLHSYEEYKDFSTTTAGGGQGARRQTRNVRAYGSSESSETLFTYVDIPSNSHIHGRLQSSVRPDGSWEYYEYLDAPYASVYGETKYTSWMDVTMANRANARVSTTTVEATTITRTIKVAGAVIFKTVRTNTVNSSNSVLKIETRDENDNILRVVETARHLDGAAAYMAGRLQWIKHADGTVTTYGYDYNANTEITTVTIRSGAGTATSISSGTQTIKELGANNIVLSETVTDISEGLLLSSWSGSNPDNKNRFQLITYGDSTQKTTTYGCCGITSQTDRTGAVTLYGQDSLRRTYCVSRKRSSTGVFLDTLTNYNGLTTSTTRGGFFVSSTARSLGGLTTTTVTPDADNDANGNNETTTRTMAYIVGGGTTTTVTYPDATTTSSVTFIDGSAKSSTDQAGNTTTYDKGTHAEQGGGLWSLTTAANVDQWTKSYSDQLGRTFKTEYPNAATATQTYYTSTAAAGSRGKLASSTDPDENATAGTGTTVSYAYNTEGQRTTTTEVIAESQTRITINDTSVATDPDVGIAQKSTTRINGKLISTSYRSVNGYGSKSVTLAGTSTSIRTIPADGAWTITSTTPDGQTAIQTYADGQLQKTESFDNTGTTASDLIASTSYTYNTLGRVLTTVDSRTGTTTVNTYTVNNLGQRTNLTTSGTAFSTAPVWAWSYNGLGELVEANDTSAANNDKAFQYDGIGNREKTVHG